MEILSKNTLKLLLVDSSEPSLKILATLLGNANCRIESALSASEGLEKLEHFEADLVMLQYDLPDMPGIELVRKLRSDNRFREMPIVVTNDPGQNSCLVKAFEAGASDYMTKPINFIELLTRIKTQVELRRTRAKLAKLNGELELLNKQKDEMLGVVSHDLKNPLAAIQSLSELLLMQDEMPTNDRRDWIDNIRQSAVYTIRLVNDLLDMNRIDRGAINLKLTCFDFVFLAERVLYANISNAAAKGQTIHLEKTDDKIPFGSDERVVYQIIDNLVSNAVKYSPKGKDITVRLETAGEDIVCRVIDNGPGLSEKDQQKLFKEFGRLSAKPTNGETSTGLGLSIVKRLAESLNGSIGCESVYGEGATFYFRLPNLSSQIEASCEASAARNDHAAA